MLFRKRLKINIFGEDELVNRIINNGVTYKNIVSIGDPGSTVPELVRKEAESILELRFLDLDEPLPNHDSTTEIMPELEDVKKVINFYNAANIKDGFTVHCWQGLSRSAAVAMCILYLYYGKEKVVFKELSSIRPYAKPNTRILKLFDGIYGTNLEIKAKDFKYKSVKKMYKNYKDKDDICDLK